MSCRLIQGQRRLPISSTVPSFGLDFLTVLAKPPVFLKRLSLTVAPEEVKEAQGRKATLENKEGLLNPSFTAGFEKPVNPFPLPFPLLVQVLIQQKEKWNKTTTVYGSCLGTLPPLSLLPWLLGESCKWIPSVGKSAHTHSFRLPFSEAPRYGQSRSYFVDGQPSKIPWV